MKLIKILVGILATLLACDALGYYLSAWLSFIRIYPDLGIQSCDNDQTPIPATILLFTSTSIWFAIVVRHLTKINFHTTFNPNCLRWRPWRKEKEAWTEFPLSPSVSEDVITKLQYNSNTILPLKNLRASSDEIVCFVSVGDSFETETLMKQPESNGNVTKPLPSTENVGCQIEVVCQCSTGDLDKRLGLYEERLKACEDSRLALERHVENTENEIVTITRQMKSIETRVVSLESWIKRPRSPECNKNHVSSINQLSALIAETKKQFEEEDDMISNARKGLCKDPCMMSGDCVRYQSRRMRRYSFSYNDIDDPEDKPDIIGKLAIPSPVLDRCIPLATPQPQGGREKSPSSRRSPRKTYSPSPNGGHKSLDSSPVRIATKIDTSPVRVGTGTKVDSSPVRIGTKANPSPVHMGTKESSPCRSTLGNQEVRILSVVKSRENIPHKTPRSSPDRSSKVRPTPSPQPRFYGSISPRKCSQSPGKKLRKTAAHV